MAARSSGLWRPTPSSKNCKSEAIMIKSCIFDLDGTLLNTINTLTHYVNKTLQKHGFGSLSADDVRAVVGNGARDLIKKCLALVGAEPSAEEFERVFSDYKAAYDTDLTYLTEPYAGIPELICELRRRGVKLGVISNKQHGATVPIVKKFFGDGFDSVFGAVDGYPLKPDPARLIWMAKEFGVELSEIAYFGDMGGDVITGKNAGVGIVGGVLWGYQDAGALAAFGADRLFENPEDILEVLL